jgi:hypothetical protein
MLHYSGPEVFAGDIIQKHALTVLERDEEAEPLFLAPFRVDRRDVDTRAVELDPEGALRRALAGVGADAELEGLEAGELALGYGVRHG